MTTNVKIFRSTDAGASAFTLYGNIPASTGSAGSLIGVLRACLLTGYNTVTATSVTIASNIATFNYTAHGFLVGQCLLIAGATPSGLNGEMYVTSVLTDSFTFAAPGISNQTATGTITAKMAPAGWTEPFASTTNITCFKQGGGNQFYFNIDETGTQGSNVTGFETMTAVGLASGQKAFPTTTQMANGEYWVRSTTADATTRAWVIIATDRVLYIHVNTDGNVTSNNGSLVTFGDIRSYRSNDGYATLITGSSSATTSNGAMAIANYTLVNNHFLVRSFTQLGTSIQCGKIYVDTMSLLPVTIGNATLTLPYPVPIDNGLWMSPIRVYESSAQIRGEMPGFWGPMHNKPLNHLDTFTGTGSLAGKTFIALTGFSVSTSGQVMIETSNTWSI